MLISFFPKIDYRFEKIYFLIIKFGTISLYHVTGHAPRGRQ